MQKEKPMPPKAKILRGNYTIVDDENSESSSGEFAPKAVVVGKLHMEEETQSERVNLRYRPENYGLANVETLEQRDLRHQEELKQVQEASEMKAQKAYERGVLEGEQKGHAKGVQEVKQHYEQLSDQLKNLLVSIQNQTDNYFKQMEKHLAAFAVEIARKVVGEVVENHKDIAIHLAKAAIMQATERHEIVILCNNEDYEEIVKTEEELRRTSEGVKKIQVEVSPKVEKGGVILETVGGSIDATIETIMDELNQAILPDYENNQEQG